MTSKQANIFLSIVIICLLIIIGFLVFNRQDDGVAPANPPTEQNEKVAEVVTSTQTVSPIAEPETENGWLTYTNSEYKFSIDYPSGSRVGTIDQVGTEVYLFEIKNTPNYQLPSLNKDQYYMQLGIFNDDSDCRMYIKDPKEIKLGTLRAYRGKGADAPFQGYRFTLCTVKDGIHYTVNVTGGDEVGAIANRMLDSFRFND